MTDKHSNLAYSYNTPQQVPLQEYESSNIPPQQSQRTNYNAFLHADVSNFNMGQTWSETATQSVFNRLT